VWKQYFENLFDSLLAVNTNEPRLPFLIFVRFLRIMRSLNSKANPVRHATRHLSQPGPLFVYQPGSIISLGHDLLAILNW